MQQCQKADIEFGVAHQVNPPPKFFGQDLLGAHDLRRLLAGGFRGRDVVAAIAQRLLALQYLHESRQRHSITFVHGHLPVSRFVCA